MVRRRLLVLTAVQIEAKAVASALRMPAPRPGKPGVSERDADKLIELHLIGIGAMSLPVVPADAMGMMLVGLAGGLDPQLAVGDVVIDGQGCESVGAGLLPIACRRGPIHTSSQMVASVSDKAKLFAQTQALAVDMESGPVAELAARAGIPWLAVRAISDAAGDALDLAMLRLIDPYGRVRISRLPSILTTGPGVAELFRLSQATRQSLRNLKAVLPPLVNHLLTTWGK